MKKAKITFEWESDPMATYYLLEINRNNEPEPMVFEFRDTLNEVIEFEASGNYVASIKACNESEIGQPSVIKNFVITEDPLGVVELIKPTEGEVFMLEEETIPTTNDAPILTIPDIVVSEQSIEVPIKTTSFDNAASCQFAINYDPSIMIATKVELGGGIPQMYFMTEVTTPGLIKVLWMYFEEGDFDGIILPDETAFLTITFNKIAVGMSPIAFDKDSPAISTTWGNGVYDKMNFEPYDDYFINGSVEFN